MQSTLPSESSEGATTTTTTTAAAAAVNTNIPNKNSSSRISLPDQETNLELSQTTNTDIDFDNGVKLAVHFLTDPKVKYSSRQRKISFLRGKGLSAEQISIAFKHAGEDVSVNEINEVSAASHRLASTLHENTTSNRSTSLSQLRNPYIASHNDSNNNNNNNNNGTNNNSNPIYFRQPAQTHTLYPSMPPPSLTQVQQENAFKGGSFDWRDVVIALGATFAAGWSGVKLFTRYSPYEFRRKDDTSVNNNVRDDDTNGWDGSSYHDMNGMARNSKYNASQLNRHGKNLHNSASNTRVDQLSTNDLSLNNVVSPLSRIHDKSRTVPPLPATPQNAVVSSEKDVAAEILQLQEEKKNLEEKLKKEQEKSAKLAMSSSQAQKSQKALANKNANLSMELDELKEKYEKLLEDKNDAAKSNEHVEDDNESQKEVDERNVSVEEQSDVNATDKPVACENIEDAQPEEPEKQTDEKTSDEAQEQAKSSEQTASSNENLAASTEILEEKEQLQPIEVVAENVETKETICCEEVNKENVTASESLQSHEVHEEQLEEEQIL